jgi:hypothetical protein
VRALGSRRRDSLKECRKEVFPYPIPRSIFTSSFGLRPAHASHGGDDVKEFIAAELGLRGVRDRRLLRRVDVKSQRLY